MQIKYGKRTQEEIRAADEKTLLDKRSIILGLGIFVLLVGTAAVYRFHFKEGSLAKLKDFEFTPQPPDTEEFELKEPLRELLEQQLDRPEMEDMETPDIQMTTDPTERSSPPVRIPNISPSATVPKNVACRKIFVTFLSVKKRSDSFAPMKQRIKIRL